MREGHPGSSPTTGGWGSTPRITAPTRRKPPARCVWSGSPCTAAAPATAPSTARPGDPAARGTGWPARRVPQPAAGAAARPGRLSADAGASLAVAQHPGHRFRRGDRQPADCLSRPEQRPLPAQQSIRTFFNQSEPQRRYVKTALSILNMGFMRGLSPLLHAGDPGDQRLPRRPRGARPLLRDCGFQLLREVAAIGYRNPTSRRCRAAPTARCSRRSGARPAGHIEPGQRLMTMAALLHSDGDERALLPTLISASDSPPTAGCGSTSMPT